MNVAFNRVRDFTAAMDQDLQQLDRNHAVSFFQLFFFTFLRLGDFSSGGCAQAHPLGVVPEIRVNCLQSALIFYTVCFFLMPSSNRETFLPVGACKRTHWV